MDVLGRIKYYRECLTEIRDYADEGAESSIHLKRVAKMARDALYGHFGHREANGKKGSEGHTG